MSLNTNTGLVLGENSLLETEGDLTSSNKTREATHHEIRLYFLQQQNKNIFFTQTASVRCSPTCNTVEAALSSIQDLTLRHQILRTKYNFGASNELLASVENSFEQPRIVKSIRSDQVVTTLAEEKQTPVNLLTSVPFRPVIVDMKGELFVIVTVHQIACDRISFNQLISELKLRLSGSCSKIAATHWQYRDYGIWLDKCGTIPRQQAFWKSYLKDLVPLVFPHDKAHGGRDHLPSPFIEKIKIDKSTSDSINVITKQFAVSRFTVFVAVLNILLFRYTDVDDICIGTLVSTRAASSDFQECLGCFENPLALRTKLGLCQSFADVIKTTNASVAEASANNIIGFQSVLDTISLQSQPRRHPIFTITIRDNSDMLDAIDSGPLHPFELSFGYSNNADGSITVSLHYDSALLFEVSAKTILEHFVCLTSTLVANPVIGIRSTYFASIHERSVIHRKFSRHLTIDDNQLCLHGIFEEAAAHNPHQIAFIFGENSLTYAELNLRSNQLAHYLSHNLKLQANDLIALFFDRGLERIIAMLAVLKAGGAYVPIDISTPQERLESILEDTESRVVLTHGNHKDSFNWVSYKLSVLDISSRELQNIVSKLPDRIISRMAISFRPDNLAYCIFTSGTTGRPKGALIEHRHVCNTIYGHQIDKPYHCKRRLLFASYAFDFDVFDVFETFLHQGTLVEVPKDQILGNLSALISKFEIDFISMTPSAVSLLDVGSLATSPLKTVSVGGEKLTYSVVKPLVEAGIKVLNEYGPTETAVSTSFAVVDDRSLGSDIGVQYPNCYHYILDPDTLDFVPIGCIGELFIAGAQVGRGYLKREDLTAKVFLDDPFNGGRMYRTGDLARVHASGRVEILGRRDQQVKLRGYRIELGEIEAVIAKHPQVSAAVVILKEDTGTPMLVAYIVPASGVKSLSSDPQISPADLKSFAARYLAPYMVPTAFVELSSIPLAGNGKLDKRALPAPATHLVDIAKPKLSSAELEKKLLDIFSQLLRKPTITNTYSFANDILCNHSLAGIVISKIRSDPLLMDLSIRDLFEAGTIRNLVLRVADNNVEADVKPGTIPCLEPLQPLGRQLSPHLFSVFQTLGLLLQYGLLVAAGGLAWYTGSILNMQFGTYWLLSGPISLICFGVSYLLAVVGLKWMVLGRVAPGDYPIWGWFHLRWWIVGGAFNYANYFILPFLRESFLLNMYLRLLGFKIGQQCIIDTTKLCGFDCIEIGEHTTISEDVLIMACTMFPDRIRIRPTVIGKMCSVGKRAVVNAGSELEDCSALGPLSSLFGTAKSGTLCTGAPAQPSGLHDFVFDWGIHGYKSFLFYFLQTVIVMASVIVVYSAGIPGALLMSLIPSSHNIFTTLLIGTAVHGFMYAITYAVIVVIAKWVLFGRIKPGWRLMSLWFRARRQLFDRIVLNILHSTIMDSLFSGTAVFGMYLRLLGARVSPSAMLVKCHFRFGVDLLDIAENTLVDANSSFSCYEISGDIIQLVPLYRRQGIWESQTAIEPLTIKADNISKNGSALNPFEVKSGKQLPEAHLSGKGPLEEGLLLSEDVEDPSDQQTNDIAAVWATQKWMKSILLLSKILVILPLHALILSIYTIFNKISDVIGIAAGCALLPIIYVLAVVIVLVVAFAFRRIVLNMTSSGSRHAIKMFAKVVNDSIFIPLEFISMNLSGTTIMTVLWRISGARVGQGVVIGLLPPSNSGEIKIDDNAVVMHDARFDSTPFSNDPINIGMSSIIEPQASMGSSSSVGEYSRLASLSTLMQSEEIPPCSVWAGYPVQYIGSAQKVSSDA